MRRIRIFVAYDGTNYCGWQIQPNGITIEEKLNKALNRLTGEDIRVIGASRTDSGVHALGNVAVFDTESPIPPERFSYALNQRLPEDIVVVKSDEVPLDWHPRYQDKISKTYEYHIYNAQMPNPLKTRYCTFVSFPLDIGAMREGAKYLIGAHDFVSFCNIRTNTQDTVRTVYDLTIEKKDDEVVLRITGNGFLYNMVRIIAGVLIRVGRGFYTPEKVKELVEKYPEFRDMYQEIYDICENVEEVVRMFSKELQELDRNTVKFMIEEQEREIKAQKEQLRQSEEELQKNQEQLKKSYRRIRSS